MINDKNYVHKCYVIRIHILYMNGAISMSQNEVILKPSDQMIS